ncbi:glycosyl-phosphatidylinositol-anchored molecule-like protein [Cricetulus griseus]|uniref:Glycosyl-phosphatidylinositol-anchored molecule-like protein n=1 Tax=Cricetulus griseus TaxID=10029 RepID=A0A9J7GUS1_CRIGR|nr:glycosyl-phosphatidylinositol-anchored molecule-like protein [Cricetulus griseus]
MLPFFWLILLVLPWVDTSINSTSVGDNSTSRVENSTTGLDIAIQPRQEHVMECHFCTTINTFDCQKIKKCQRHMRSCGTIAVRMNSWELLVYKNCMENCMFVLTQLLPTVLERWLPTTNSYFYSNCCSGILCNDGGPTNVQRDFLPPLVVHEDVIARAVYLGVSNLLLSLALILSSSIQT